MNNKLQLVKCKTKLKIYKNIRNYYDEMNIRRQSGNFQFEEDPYSKGVQGIDKIYHEVLLLRKFYILNLRLKIRILIIMIYIIV